MRMWVAVRKDRESGLWLVTGTLKRGELYDLARYGSFRAFAPALSWAVLIANRWRRAASFDR